MGIVNVGDRLSNFNVGECSIFVQNLNHIVETLVVSCGIHQIHCVINFVIVGKVELSGVAPQILKNKLSFVAG